MPRIALLTTLLVLLVAPAASAATSAEWNGAVAGHAEKVPDAFSQRLQYALPDGTLRVMVALERRDAAIESFAQGSTTWLQWYGAAPRFLARVTPAELTQLVASDAVSFVEPDYPIVLSDDDSNTDAHASSAGDGSAIWSYDPVGGPLGALRADAPGLTPQTATGTGVKVAIVDSGIDRTHQDFGGWDCARTAYQPCESRIAKAVVIDHLVGDGADPQGLPTTEVASGHGTHVAGIVAGNGYMGRDGTPDPKRYGGGGIPFGMAPQAQIVSLKNGDTLWAGLSSFGLQWILDHPEEGVRVVNNSWGCVGGCAFNGSSATAQMFKDLYAQGVLVLFAAGNDGGTADGKTFSGNAQSPYVLGVAAHDDATDQLADFSSRGDGATTLADPATWTPESEGANGVRRPDLSAPGVDIWAARTLTGGAASGVPRVGTEDATGGNGSGIVPYAIMSGTSMATPHVAGAAALLLSACPSSRTLDLMRALMAGADRTRIQQTGGTGTARPFEAGYGGLNVRASLDWLRANAGCAGGTATTAPATTATTTTTTDTAAADTSGTGTGTTTEAQTAAATPAAPSPGSAVAQNRVARPAQEAAATPRKAKKVTPRRCPVARQGASRKAKAKARACRKAKARAERARSRRR